MRVLAIDYGSARCGLAVSDPSGTVVRPLKVIKQVNKPAAWQELLAVVKELEIEVVVVGLPLLMSGEDGSQTEATRLFSQRLAAAIKPIKVELYDERLTTKLAQRDGGSAPEDARAAAHLLDAWLMRREVRLEINE